MSARDAQSIAQLLARLYEVISFDEGDEPDFEGLSALFAAHARITRITPEGTDYLDLPGFLAMTRNMLELGAYTSFYEFELARQVECFGNFAQVWSVYETRRHRRALGALNRGVNSIQLVRSQATEQGASWRVLSLLWDETHARPDLDLKAVFAKGAVHGQA
jgi:hypothetical protein